MAILHSNLLHVAVHHPTKFQAYTWMQALERQPCPLDLIQTSKLCGKHKNWSSIALLNSDLHLHKFQANTWKG